MTTFQIIIHKIAIHFSKPVWSFVRNCMFWLFRLNKIAWVRNQMKDLRAWDLEPLMAIFMWVEDKGGDWTQWASTLVYNELKGDCDDAAALAKWWFKQNGVEADIFNLYSDKEGHAVCVTNERVVNLNPTCWEKEMLEYFGNKYTIVI